MSQTNILKTTKGLEVGNLLELCLDGETVLLTNGNQDFKTAQIDYGVSLPADIVKVVKLGEDEINDIPIKYFQPIYIEKEWLKKLGCVPFGQNNISIGKLNFQMLALQGISLIRCNEEFERISETPKISYVHGLQNYYRKETGEELEYDLSATLEH